MKKEQTFTWTTKSGNEIEYILGCEYRDAFDEVIDGGWGGTISHKAKIIFTTRVSANGAQLFELRFGGDILRDAMTGKGFTDKTDKDVIAAGGRYYVAGHGNDNQFYVIIMPEDIYNSIAETMNDFENSFEDIVKEKADKLKTEKAELLKFIEKAENQNWLPTRLEYMEWRKAHNNVMNEGGEGYIPEAITKEALEYAKLRLEGLSE